MILEAFKRMIKFSIFGKSSTVGSETSNVTTQLRYLADGLKDTGGNIISPTTTTNCSAYKFLYSLLANDNPITSNIGCNYSSQVAYGGTRMLLGSSDKPVEEDDYALEWLSQSASGLHAVSFNTANTGNNVTLVASFINNGTTDITIKEFGIVAALQTDSTSAGSNFLLTRDVLETPVVLQSGQTLTITMTF